MKSQGLFFLCGLIWIHANHGLQPRPSQLVTKDFVKSRIRFTEDIEDVELGSISGMDWNYCSYLCMKEGEDCKQFYISNEGSCRKVIDQCFEKGKKGANDTRMLYSTVQAKIIGKLDLFDRVQGLAILKI